MQGALLANRYLLGAAIGAGGMGVVYRATDLRTGGVVAVKVVHPAIAHLPEYLRRLRREAELAAALTSPRVVRVTDLDQHEGTPFLVMEYVPGPTLAEVLAEQGRLPLDQALFLCLEVARALEAADQLGIAHRDLKPDNIKLVEGQVKVLDFGIAKAVAAGDRHAATGQYIGTPAYSAPERAAGLGDTRVDIYALGVILFELIEGRPPFEGRTALEVMQQHASLAPPPLTRAVPPNVQQILARCLAKRPEDRYQTPTALREALQAATRRSGALDLPPLEGGAAASSAARAGGGRRPLSTELPTATAGATGTAALTGAATQPRGHGRPPPPRRGRGRSPVPVALAGAAAALVLGVAGLAGLAATRGGGRESGAPPAAVDGVGAGGTAPAPSTGAAKWGAVGVTLAGSGASELLADGPAPPPGSAACGPCGRP
ncbi:MAG: serine/threonine-protein kinase [Dehalococcoidia bacterium]